MAKTSNRPRDANPSAKLVVDLAVRDADEPDMMGSSETPEPGGRAGGLVGGIARSKALAPTTRSEIARTAEGWMGLTVSLGYPRTSTASGATTTFLYDGDDLVGEYDASGNILNRYVPGPGVDEPVVWYAGPGTATRRWYQADDQGSIVAWSDATGALEATRAYDPHGQPDHWLGSRFAYTGQIAIPEAKLYHYKSRVYDPALGRFLQTDPIGYAGDLNLYAYAGDDPVNGSDPSGLAVQNQEDTRKVCDYFCGTAGWPVETSSYSNGFSETIDANGNVTFESYPIVGGPTSASQNLTEQGRIYVNQVIGGLSRGFVGGGEGGGGVGGGLQNQQRRQACQNAVQASNFLNGLSRGSGTAAAGLGLSGLAVEGLTLGAATPVAGLIELGAGGLEAISLSAGAASAVIRTAGTGNFTSAVVFGGTQALINASGLGGIPGVGKVGNRVASAIIDQTIGRAAPESECH